MKPKPESQETFDVSFRYRPGFADIANRTKKLAEELRELAAEKAKVWLLDHGYFNGRFDTAIHHDAKERRVDVKVTVMCFGLPEAKFERAK